jgi:hypothetical protein
MLLEYHNGAKMAAIKGFFTEASEIKRPISEEWLSAGGGRMTEDR